MDFNAPRSETLRLMSGVGTVVVIETRDGAVMVSPGDPKKFIDAVKPSK